MLNLSLRLRTVSWTGTQSPRLGLSITTATSRGEETRKLRTGSWNGTPSPGLDQLKISNTRLGVETFRYYIKRTTVTRSLDMTVWLFRFTTKSWSLKWRAGLDLWPTWSTGQVGETRRYSTTRSTPGRWTASRAPSPGRAPAVWRAPRRALTLRYRLSPSLSLSLSPVLFAVIR